MEALATDKWTVLPTPALAAASNRTFEFSTTWSKVVPCARNAASRRCRGLRLPARPEQTVRVQEVHTRGYHQTAKGAAPIRVAGQRSDAYLLVLQRRNGGWDDRMTG